MERRHESHSCLVTWRGQKFIVEINPNAALKELGEKLQNLTNVKADTLRLLVPIDKSSKLLYPFSDEHSFLKLEETSVLKGKSIRMMGVLKDEVDEVIQNAKLDHRIAGFDEEEKRLRQRNIDRHHRSWKLPHGTYIFCDFRTLSLPGVELNPPAPKAMELLHMLASDPGIVAIMNKHRWRVGILTEMAPIGYVGVTPKCILGFNKNCGEEISLRLRTDDLKGFRKYQSIKKTLLHELAHMVHSEHDASFYALDKQLNEEAAALDWTKSRGHTLSGAAHSHNYEVEFEYSNGTASQKLGGHASILPNARASSVNAAFQRLATTFITPTRLSEVQISEPDPDEVESDNFMEINSHVESGENHVNIEVDPDGVQIGGLMPTSDTERYEDSNPDNTEKFNGEVWRNFPVLEHQHNGSVAEPNHARIHNIFGPDQIDSLGPPSLEVPDILTSAMSETDLIDAQTEVMQLEPGSIDSLGPPSLEVPDILTSAMSETDLIDAQTEVMQLEPGSGEAIPSGQIAEPETDDQELKIIQDPVTVVCTRLQNAIMTLKNEANPSEAGIVLQTLTKIICNVAEHPNELKFKKLRKGNPTIQRNIVRYKAAMDILELIGFYEDVIIDEFGKAENFLVFKRNDPGLLWLAKSSLQTSIAGVSKI